jgi:hypothetical protein
MTVTVSKHAKKRVKQRYGKNYQAIAEKAFNEGVEHSKLKGSLKKHVDWLAMKGHSKGYKVTMFKVYNGEVFLFGGNILITVLHLPAKILRMALKLKK